MPILIEHLTELVFALVLMVLLGNGVVAALTIVRRHRRQNYFQRIDDLRLRYGPVIDGMLSHKVDYLRGLALLKNISGPDRHEVLEQLCMERAPTTAEVPALRQLCEDLGLVKVWQRHLTGRFDVSSPDGAHVRPGRGLQSMGRWAFLMRAQAAEFLAATHHQPSWPLLIKALDDPHPDVQGVALRALAAIQEPRSFPALVERLHVAVLRPAGKVSLRLIKSALVSFPLDQAVALLPSLRHPQRRIRFLATDTIREMVDREAARGKDFVLQPNVFARELTEVFLTQLCLDENPDVRARAAPVIACLQDARSIPALATLLDDSQWFVRLHAVRALAKPRFLPQAAEISRRLTDPHWMVREAAARTLLVLGRAGVDQLSAHFLATQDRYGREQIADDVQRAGLIPTLLAQFLAETNGKERQVIEQLAQMGKTSTMLVLLKSTPNRNLRKKFLENFGKNADPQIQAWVKQVAIRETDPELRALARAAIGAAVS